MLAVLKWVLADFECKTVAPTGLGNVSVMGRLMDFEGERICIGNWLEAFCFRGCTTASSGLEGVWE